jgi:hypothetical protein
MNDDQEANMYKELMAFSDADEDDADNNAGPLLKVNQADTDSDTNDDDEKYKNARLTVATSVKTPTHANDEAETPSEGTDMEEDLRTKSPSPAKTKSPSPAKTKSPSPARTKSPSPAKMKSPSPAKMKSPSPTRTKSPSPAKTKRQPSVSSTSSSSITEIPKPMINMKRHTNDRPPYRKRQWRQEFDRNESFFGMDEPAPRQRYWDHTAKTMRSETKSGAYSMLDDNQKKLSGYYYQRIRKYYVNKGREIPISATAPMHEMEAEFHTMNAEKMETLKIAEYKQIGITVTGFIESGIMFFLRWFKMNTIDITGLSNNYKLALEDNDAVLYALYDKYGQRWDLNPLVTCAMLLWGTMRETNRVNMEKRSRIEADVARYRQQTVVSDSTPAPKAEHVVSQTHVDDEWCNSIDRLTEQINNMTLKDFQTSDALKLNQPLAAATVEQSPKIMASPKLETDPDGNVKRGISFD